MAKQLMPKAELLPRPTDVPLTDEQFMKIGLFAQLKRKPTLEKFPGALVLRRYRAGEVIFRQGEAGWTAFYILTTEDLAAVGQEAAGGPPSRPPSDAGEEEPSFTQTLRPEEMRTVLQRLTELGRGRSEERLRTVATAHLATARPAARPRTGLLEGLRRRLGGGGAAPRKPLFIPIDGPRDLDYNTRQSPLYEGDLFGEMGCLYRAPRSTTVVATRDCYVLEMLRNILDQLQKDPAYKARTDEVYKERVLSLHLRQLAIFADLTELQFAALSRGIELVTFESGQIVCDEHERSDAMYIVRSGMVKVLKKASAMLDVGAVRNWPALWAALRQGAAKPASPEGKVWQLLPEKVRAFVQAHEEVPQTAEDDRQEVLYALNDLVKSRTLADAKEFQEVLARPTVQARAADFPAGKRKDWADADLRRFNRLLLEAVFGDALRTYRRRVGPEVVLNYCARGEVLGEGGLLARKPRGATCVAQGHPREGNKEPGQVELVRLPEGVFWQLVQSAPAIRQKLEAEIARRERQTRKRAGTSLWEEAEQPHFSERFAELGLIQGQRLMLIDLDRCTRCDECVKACVNTHDDGRSRLFLDGPRFGNYLVPTTCRSCLDPVCMVSCPVGSIHRGNDNQMVIEDWCIGCNLCANQCPYGSIQMHDVGVVPEAALGWRFMPASGAAEGWQQPRHDARQWGAGRAPFRHGRDFRDRLAPLGVTGAKDRAVCFRYEFDLARDLAKPDSRFKMELTSTDPAAAVWINGREVHPVKPKAGKREYALPQRPAGAPADAPVPPATELFRAGRNVIAVRVMPPPSSSDEVMFDLRLDAIHRPPGAAAGEEEVTEKLVTERAVVCDLCAGTTGVPACVHACPHDAAMRVDARFEFPQR